MIPRRTMMAAAGPTYPDVVLRDRPYAYYRIEQATDALAMDATPARRDAAWYGAVRPVEAGLVRGAKAAVRFDAATGAYLDVPFGLDPAASNATFEIWIRTPAALPDGGRQILLTQRGGTGESRSWLYIDDVDRDGFGAHSLNTGLGGAPCATGVIIAPATRYHLVLEVTPGVWRLYANGQAKQGGDWAPQTADGTFVVGLDPSSNQHPFQGIAAEIAFYTHALGDARVQAHYEAAG